MDVLAEEVLPDVDRLGHLVRRRKIEVDVVFEDGRLLEYWSIDQVRRRACLPRTERSQSLGPDWQDRSHHRWWPGSGCRRSVFTG